VRGKERQIASYLAQRGWFDSGVQRVLRKWMPTLGSEAVKEAFLALRRVYENGSGTVLEVDGPWHLKFMIELACALEKLHGLENCAGWVVKTCGRLRPGTHIDRRPLLSYEQMAREIQAMGGPKFSVAALKKAAQRLKLSGLYQEAERELDLL